MEVSQPLQAEVAEAAKGKLQASAANPSPSLGHLVAVGCFDVACLESLAALPLEQEVEVEVVGVEVATPEVRAWATCA